jgi:chromosomal replication initiation ATPase DnaA
LDTADPAIAGQRGHDTTYRVLCQIFNGFALSPEQAWQAAVYYNAKCDPPWSEKELKHKVDDALKAESSQPRGHLLGSDAEPPFAQKLKEEQRQREGAPKRAQPEPQDIQEKLFEELLRKFSGAIRTSGQLEKVSIAPREKLLGSWLYEGDLGFVYGERGSGKTWFINAIGVHLSTGSELHGWKVKKSR